MTDQLTQNFWAHEFACPCCGASHMNEQTMKKLQALRGRYGKPIHIVEGGGFRCANYDKSQYGAHKEGRAVDPTFPREDLYRLIQLAIRCGFTGIGVKNKDGKFQLHLDDAPNLTGKRPRPWIWTY